MAYTPPNATAVELAFSGTYAAPPAGATNLEFDVTTAQIRYASAGLDNSRVGNPSLIQTQFVRPKGFAETFGRIVVSRVELTLFPIGVIPGPFGTAVVGTRRFIDVTGIAPADGYASVQSVELVARYFAPPAYNIILDWSGAAYAAPPASNVILEFVGSANNRILGATLFSQTTFGVATVVKPQQIIPTGIPSGGLGSVIAGKFGIDATGIARTTAYGTPTITLKARVITAPSIVPPPQTGPNQDRIVPDPTIIHRLKYVYPAGLAADPIATTHSATHFIRFFDFTGFGLAAGSVGAPFVGYRVRYLDQQYVPLAVVGIPTVGGSQVVALTGWASSRVAVYLLVEDNTQRVFPDYGLVDPAKYGTASMYNARDVVYSSGIAAGSVNFPVVYNKTKFVAAAPFMDTNNDPTGWPLYGPYVENRNQKIGPFGYPFTQFSAIGNLVQNAARLLISPSIAAGVFGTETTVTHFHRSLLLDGWQSSYVWPYAVTYNNSRAISVVGLTSGESGQPSTENLNRTIRHHTPNSGEVIGVAFVAYAIRTVEPRSANSSLAPQTGVLDIRNNPYPVSPGGIDSARLGAATLEEHFSVIRPVSMNVFLPERFGVSLIANRNRTLTPEARVYTEFGQTRIFNYVQYLTVTCDDQSLVSPISDIGYRNRTIYLSPTGNVLFTPYHAIRNVIPPPPAPQYIYPAGLVATSIGSATLNIRGLKPAGIAPGLFGSTSVKLNSIRVDRGIFDLEQVGTPVLIFTQYILARSHPNPEVLRGDSDAFPAKPRFTPHTVYAPSADQATAQARANHPSSNPPHVIDDYVVGADGTRHPAFGRPVVSNKNRSIGPVPVHDNQFPDFSRYGVARLFLRLQYVYPRGMRPSRVPIPLFLGVPQYISLNAENLGIAPLNTFGVHKVAPPLVVFNNIQPAGIAPIVPTNTIIRLFRQNLYPEGIVHRGNPQQNLTNPWGLPAISYTPLYREIGGGVLTVWGTARIEYLHREVYPVGWDSLSLIRDDIGSFRYRMRVTRTQRKILPAGIVGYTVPNPVVTR